ncbi:MAG: DNA adenine methylase, partial [Candidatus Thermoplasmatota archaeon]|nr:DNA adenine methylase [Candidatus Thermoplasmatota archaeon]
MIRIMKYPGAKGSLISEIRTLFYASGANFFVDVFGGSGVVSLNVCSPAVLYNDLDPRLYNLFMALAKYPDEIYRNLYEKYSDLAGKLSRKG